MTIEEMKAKGYKRYTAFIEKLIITNKVEVYAKDWDDAYAIFENVAEKLPESVFEFEEQAAIQKLEPSTKPLSYIAAAQPTVTEYNEDFYKNEEM